MITIDNELYSLTAIGTLHLSLAFELPLVLLLLATQPFSNRLNYLRDVIGLLDELFKMQVCLQGA